MEEVLHQPQETSKAVDELCINTIRMLSADAVEKANSGHAGMPMGAAAMAYVLWTRFLKHNPANPNWPDRDRFVLSAGHGSMLLYGLLHLTGYDLSIEAIKNFRQWGSSTPGHPEFRHTPGVETTTGPLGQGFANGVGLKSSTTTLMPLSATVILWKAFPTKPHPLPDTWGLANSFIFTTITISPSKEIRTLHLLRIGPLVLKPMAGMCSR
jgi:hypothetical protein